MKYVVSVTRTGYACADFEIEAENTEVAKELALEAAEEHQFSEHSSEYEVSQISPQKN